MKTYKYPLGKQSNIIRIGNLLDDIWQVHEYFHKWQRQRHKDGLPYVGFEGMCDHVKVLKDTTHPHWKALPSQAIQQELKRIHKAYDRFFKKLGGNGTEKAALSPSNETLVVIIGFVSQPPIWILDRCRQQVKALGQTSE